MIYIYYCYLSEEDHDSLLKINSPKFLGYFQEKLKRFRKWQDAQLSLLGRLLLFKGLEEIYRYNLHDKVIKYSKYSKPYFEGDLIKFNISHSGEIVVCALTDEAEIGIDIEILSDLGIDGFKFQMTNNEWRSIILSTNKTDSFFDYWAQKEAVIKVHGNGLSIPLNSFEVSANMVKINDDIFFMKEIEID